jgi:hypothetical protein
MDPMTAMAVAMAAKQATESMKPKPMSPPQERLAPTYGQPMQGPAANYDPMLVPGAGVTAPAPYMGQQPPMDFGQMAQVTADSGFQYMPPASSLDRLRDTSRSGRSRIDGLLGGIAAMGQMGQMGQAQQPMPAPPPMAPMQGEQVHGPAYDYLKAMRQQTGLLGGF